MYPRRPPSALAASWRQTAVLLLVLTGILGCSTERRYRALSFWFDGVPDPNAPPIDEEETPAEGDRAARVAAIRADRRRAARAPPPPPVSVHAPYADKACMTCHPFTDNSRRRGLPQFSLQQGVSGGQGLLVKPVGELCVTCHEEYGREAAAAAGLWLHGPVAAGACTFCHDQHSSKYPRLLRTAQARVLCLRCHDALRLDANADHPSMEELEDEDCTTCHDPHQGTSRFLM